MWYLYFVTFARGECLQLHIIVWIHPTNAIPTRVVPLLQSWERAGYPTQLFTDTECQNLAKQWQCNGYFRSDIMNITKADLCRYFATYEYGGVYSDLDVQLTDGNVDLSCTDLCTAREYAGNRKRTNFASHVFSASKHSPCLERAIHHTCHQTSILSMDFKADPHVVHNMAGPNGNAR